MLNTPQPYVIIESGPGDSRRRQTRSSCFWRQCILRVRRDVAPLKGRLCRFGPYAF